MYSKSEEEFKNIKARIKNEAPINFIKRFEKNCKKQEQWVHFYRSRILYRNHDTNNYAKASIRILKDILLNRTKAYNVVALVDFIVSVGEKYFTLRILNHAHGRYSENKRLYEKLCSKMIDFDESDLKQINESTYAIPSMTTENVTYFVDTENGACTCKMGHAGSFCKHQAWIHKHIEPQLPNSPAVTLEERHKLAALALGIDKCPKPTFFLGLKESLPSNSEIICKTLNQIVNNSEYCELYVNEKGKLQRDTIHFSDKLNIENNECILSETTTSNEISS